MSKADNAVLTLAETEIILKRELSDMNYADGRVHDFIIAYLDSHSITQASKAAKVSLTKGYAMLNTPDIIAAIGKLQTKAGNKVGVKAGALIRKIEEISEVNIMDMLDERGCVLPKELLAPELQRAIKKFKVRETWAEIKDMNGMVVGERQTGRIIEVELYDKMKATELLARDEGIFTETKKVQHEVGKNAAAILLEQSVKLSERVVSELPVVELPYTGGQDARVVEQHDRAGGMVLHDSDVEPST